MAAPMTPAQPYRDSDVMAKEDAIKKRLKTANDKSLTAAKKAKKGSYTNQAIMGTDKGYTPSDYGVGKGAAIPYEIATTQNSVRSIGPVKKPGAPDHTVTSIRPMPPHGPISAPKPPPISHGSTTAISRRLGGK